MTLKNIIRNLIEEMLSEGKSVDYEEDHTRSHAAWNKHGHASVVHHGESHAHTLEDDMTIKNAVAHKHSDGYAGEPVMDHFKSMRHDHGDNTRHSSITIPKGTVVRVDRKKGDLYTSHPKHGYVKASMHGQSEHTSNELESY